MYTLQFYTGQLAPAYMYIYMYMYTCVTAVLTPVRVARGAGRTPPAMPPAACRASATLASAMAATTTFVKCSEHNGKPCVHVGNAAMSLKVITGGGHIVWAGAPEVDVSVL